MFLHHLLRTPICHVRQTKKAAIFFQNSLTSPRYCWHDLSLCLRLRNTWSSVFRWEKFLLSVGRPTLDGGKKRYVGMGFDGFARDVLENGKPSQYNSCKNWVELGKYTIVPWMVWVLNQKICQRKTGFLSNCQAVSLRLIKVRRPNTWLVCRETEKKGLVDCRCVCVCVGISWNFGCYSCLLHGYTLIWCIFGRLQAWKVDIHTVDVSQKSKTSWFIELILLPNKWCLVVEMFEDDVLRLHWMIWW